MMTILQTVTAFLLLLTCSLLVTATLRPPSKPAWVLSIYLVIYADIILSCEICHTFRVMNQTWAMLTTHALLAALAWLVWLHAGKPNVCGPFSTWKKEFRQDIRRALLHYPELVLLGTGVLAAYLTIALLIVVVPPNNNDSMSTHLSRVGYWLQYGSFFPWPTARILQLIYPVNAQLQMFWTTLFWGSDALVGFMQWFAALASAAAIFGLSRWMGWKRAQAGFAALIYLSFPLVLLQSSTTQNDLAAAAMYILTIFFFLSGMREKNKGMLFLSALSLGAGLGTKQNCFFLLPGMAILIGLLWIQKRHTLIKPLISWSLMSIVCFLLFGAYQYGINQAVYHNPIGPDEFIENQTDKTTTIHASQEKIAYNIPRLLYQSIDVSGLPKPLDGYSHKLKAVIFRKIFNAAGFRIEGTLYTTPPHIFNLSRQTENQEDEAWYGPLGFLLLCPCTIFHFIIGLRKREPVRIGLILNGVLFLIADAWQRPGWDPFQGRYFAPVVALNTVLIAGLIQPGKLARMMRWMIVTLALTTITVTMLYNPAKPLAGKKAEEINIWKDDRVIVQTIQGGFAREFLRMIDDIVPKDTTIGLYTPAYVWEYPIFGKHFERRLVPIYPFTRSNDINWLKDQGVQYILVQTDTLPTPILPHNIDLEGSTDGWMLYRLIP